ncbi:MAG: ATP-binding protein [Verrucomicrobiota bacterium]
MLIQFTVGNFKSFKDKATLSLEATNDDWREDDNVAQNGGNRLVKASAIYGPNAGGKSNFLAAMAQFRELIKESSKDTQKGEPIPVTPFRLHSTTEAAPSFFEAVFLQKGTRYRYGFEATQQAILSEWLFSQTNSTRETRLFTREKDVIEPAESFKEGKGLEKRTRSNALFLSVAAQFNGEIAGEIVNWMNHFRSVSGLNDGGYMDFTAKRLNDPEYGPLIRELVKQADVGIENLERQDIAADKLPKMIPKGSPEAFREFILRTAVAGAFTVKTSHKRFDADDKPAGMVKFDLKVDESAGTQKFVALTGPFLHTLREGAVLFVDELEARLHPLLTKALVGLFNSSANRNNAQLIFATHDEGLLDAQHIRRDQVWFVEKNGFGASRLFCLDEIKGVRKEAKFAKEYLLGQFGGVPRVGDLQGVLNHAGK